MPAIRSSIAPSSAAPQQTLLDHAPAAKRMRKKPVKPADNFAATPDDATKAKTKSGTQRSKTRKARTRRQPRSIIHLGCYVPEHRPPEGVAPANAPAPQQVPNTTGSSAQPENELRLLAEQVLAAAAIHGTDRVKSLLAGLIQSNSRFPSHCTNTAGGPRQWAAVNTPNPPHQSDAPEPSQREGEKQNCEYTDLNVGQANAQIPQDHKPATRPPQALNTLNSSGSEVWLGSQGGTTDIFSAMKAFFEKLTGQGGGPAASLPRLAPMQFSPQRQGPLGQAIGEAFPLPAAQGGADPKPATRATGAAERHAGTTGQEHAANSSAMFTTSGNAPVINAAQYICTVGSLSAHVSAAVKAKICRNEYVDIFDLLRRDGEGAEPKCHEACKLASKDKPIIARTLANWSAGFRILSSIIGEKQPEKCCALIKYQDVICSMYRTYGDTSWLEYDEQFRQNMAVSPSLDWDCKDIALWLSKITPVQEVIPGFWGNAYQPSTWSAIRHQGFPGRQPFCQGQRFTQPTRFRGGAPICWLYNAGYCRYAGACKFRHSCTVCGAGHPQSRCMVGCSSQQTEEH
ncbi:uncharacterized protein LOC115085924 [Rhinatrema bivittatum]|uniref:uncharacterized protein LOC115085924 n=1 Tax=Rhinatrema bivittatum TaxID=194408 RepID=UPI0011288C73|nr:uncharacterized protein LOC115085924 [Rhinatrema bivittatum]